ncbi:MAG: ligase-associated box helicase [Rubritepida sp.]|nr:ligase-associated box helicase [Rubritepida sp.]
MPRAHQLDMLEAARAARSALLIAPTGGGKTLAGFLPSLIDLYENPRKGLHTLYISPLKALAVDIARNLEAPIAEMELDIRVETRTGDTPANRRARQRETPPNILLTTPESLTLLLSLPDADKMFGGLHTIVVDEAHALAGTKRGDQLSLCLSRLSVLAPGSRRVGLSATVNHPEALCAWLSPTARAEDVTLIRAEPGAPPVIGVLLPQGRLPWGGHMGIASAPEIMERIAASRVTIVFVNTRAQAELIFAALWKLNEDALPIGLHHGSLTIEQRRKVEAAMADGRLRGVVATSSLDLGIDWGGVDQVIQVAAPKGVSRLLQRVGRANHRMDEASAALLVPANRFEVIECAAAIQSVEAGELDGEPPRPGGLDVLAQHILAMACHAPFLPDDLYAEIIRAGAYADLSRRDFDDTLRFVEDGGYALASYERYRKLFRDSEGFVHVRGTAVTRQLRLNLGTIVEAPLLKVKLRGGPMLGEVEEWFISTLTAGDCFMFAGQILRYEGMSGVTAEVTRGGEGDPRVPAYAGSRMPLSTHLAERVRGILSDPAHWELLPESVREWLEMQTFRSELPSATGLLVETFPRGGRWFLVAYCFEGRLAHQTLGMLATRRMERLGWGPLGFVATDYVLSIWSAFEPSDPDALFTEDLLGEELEEWIADSSMLRRTFRSIATIAGLIEKNHPSVEKSRKQMSVNSDLIYNVLRRHEPDHILLRATRAEAAFGLTDVRRLATLLARSKGHIRHRRLDHVSPLAVPALIEIGHEWVSGNAEDAVLAEAIALVDEATEGAQAFTGNLSISDAVEERPRPAGAARPRRSRFIRHAPKGTVR